MNCPECKANIADDVRICPECGGEIPAKKRKSMIPAVIISIVLLLLIGAGVTYLCFFTDVFKADKASPVQQQEQTEQQKQLAVDLIKAIESNDNGTVIELFNDNYMKLYTEDYGIDEYQALEYICQPYQYYAGDNVTEYYITVMNYQQYVDALYEAEKKQCADPSSSLDLEELEDQYEALDVEEHLQDSIDQLSDLIEADVSDLNMVTAELTYADGTKGAYLLIVALIDGKWELMSCDLDQFISEVYLDEANCAVWFENIDFDYIDDEYFGSTDNDFEIEISDSDILSDSGSIAGTWSKTDENGDEYVFSFDGSGGGYCISHDTELDITYEIEGNLITINIDGTGAAEDILGMSIDELIAQGLISQEDVDGLYETQTCTYKVEGDTLYIDDEAYTRID